MKRLLIICIVMAINVILCYSKTMHVIAFCNTNDYKIGQAAVVSHDMYNEELNHIAYLLGYEYDPYSFVEDECSKENLEKIIASCTSNPEDIIVFYYFGHGTRAEDQKSPFPQMCLKYDIYNQDKFVPVQYVINRLKHQAAHLKLIISMCCNNKVDGVSPKNSMCEAMGPTSLSGVNIDNYRKLFNDFNGTLAITGSEPGQYSWCNSQIGGFFDIVFWAALEAVGQNQLTADWNTIFENVRNATDQIAYARTNPPVHQLPYYEIEEGNTTPRVPRDKEYNPHSEKRTPGPKSSDELQNSISLMIGTDDINQRMDMVEKIISSCLNGNGDMIVQLMGRNQRTVIETTNIRSYLRSVAKSDKILRVNNLGTTEINNRQVLKLHEIRR